MAFDNENRAELEDPNSYRLVFGYLFPNNTPNAYINKLSLDYKIVELPEVNALTTKFTHSPYSDIIYKYRILPKIKEY